MLNATAARITRQPKSKFHRKEQIYAFLFVLIPLIGFVVFTLVTLVISAFFSLTNLNPVRGIMDFKGFENYISLFLHPTYGRDFIDVVLNTLFLLMGVPISMAISIVFAAIMSGRKFKGSGVFRALIYLPSVTSVLAINFVWRTLLHDEFGLVNALLGTNIKWMTDFTLVKVSMMIKNIWAGLGVNIILFMAGMQNVSPEYYEAADLDGASPIKQFLKITMPMLTPIIFYTIITGIIGTLQIYADTDYFANGNRGARTIVYFVWMYGINQNRYGLASAASMLLAVVIMLVTVLQFKFSKWVYSE